MVSIFKKLFAPGDDTKLKEALSADAILIDVRSASEFATGSIKGSVNIPLDRLGSQVQVLKNDKPIVVFCRSGNRSMTAKAILQQKGFSNIIDGGSINSVNKLIANK